MGYNNLPIYSEFVLGTCLDENRLSPNIEYNGLKCTQLVVAECRLLVVSMYNISRVSDKNEWNIFHQDGDRCVMIVDD